MDQVGIEHRRVVGVERDVEPFVHRGAQRVRGQRRGHAGADVAGRADLQRDLPLAQFGHQRRVFCRAYAVADPLRAEGPHLAPVPPARRLARVGREMEAAGPRRVHRRAEGQRRHLVLHAAQAQRHHAPVLPGDGPFDRLHGPFDAEITRVVGDEAQDHAVLFQRGGGSGGDAVHHLVERQAGDVDMARGREGRLDVADVLPGGVVAQFLL